MTSPPKKHRVLFIAEAVTLAHVARAFSLAQSLDANTYDVFLACDPRYRALLPQVAFPIIDIASISSDEFLHALANGSPLYSRATLTRYVEDDLRLLRDLKPDVVIGDFRLSLSISARLTSTPYLTVTNAYWGPYTDIDFPVPELPFVKLLGVTVGQALFSAVRPIAFALHTLPLNAVRREYGLASLGFDLRRTYTDADITLYADIPEMVRVTPLPDNHQFIGPVYWAPNVPLPGWWDALPNDKPIVYVNLGSSGQARLLPTVLKALESLPVSVIAATAGRIKLDHLPSNAFVADYIPGDLASARAKLVICNGGSPTCQQAFAAGVPVLGIASNLDQFLNMQLVEHVGAGKLMRAGQTTPSRVHQRCSQLLSDPCYGQRARQLAELSDKSNTCVRFEQVLHTLLASQ